MSLLDEVAQLLDVLGLGTYAPSSGGGDVFLNRLPPEPDEATAVARYGGGEADAANPYDEVRLQLRCRGTSTDSRTAEDRAQNIYDELHGLRSITLPGGTWLVMCVGVQGGPVYMGADAHGRDEFVVNLRAEFERVTTHRH